MFYSSRNMYCYVTPVFLCLQKLKAQVEASRSESARIDAQWQTSSQSVAEQVTALRDENDDLRFQVRATPSTRRRPIEGPHALYCPPVRAPYARIDVHRRAQTCRSAL